MAENTSPPPTKALSKKRYGVRRNPSATPVRTMSPAVNRTWRSSDQTTKHTQQPQVLSDARPNERAALSSITLRSGGATFPSSFEDQRNILRISQQIAIEMQRQYTLSFYQSELPDGKWHSLRVGLRGVPDSKKFVLTHK